MKTKLIPLKNGTRAEVEQVFYENPEIKNFQILKLKNKIFGLVIN